jgi:hypothetical protein
MYFEDSYTRAFPGMLYRSQSPYYILPHYFATLVGGEPGFWFVTGLVPILMAVVISASLACIAWLSVESIAKWQQWAGVRGSQFVAAVSTFSVSFSSEPIWSLTWDTFDGSWSVVFYVLALAIALLYRRLNLSPARGGGGWLPCLLLVTSALICPRFGFTLVLVQLLIRVTGFRKFSPFSTADSCLYNRLCGWQVIAFVFFASLTHFLRLAFAIFWQGLNFRGSEMLPRMGLSGWWENAAQDKLHYLTPLDAFTFIWRQSAIVIHKLPLWVSVHHLVIWSVALIAFAAMFSERRYYYARPILEFLFFPALLWVLIHNQSAAEHPDLYAIFWVPAYSLGLAFLLTRFFSFLRQRCRREHAYLYTSFSIWLLFLWQNQYFMRAYPQL